MAGETPSWMNLEFVEKIMRKSKNDDSIHVLNIFIKPATAKGDNYTSDMYRVSLEISSKRGNEKVTKKESLIIKVAPTGENIKKELIEKSKIFDTEILMMMDTLKKMSNLIEPAHRINARIFYVQKEYPVFLVIEDLATLGFRMADRQAGLDLPHCLLAMRGLARFHASSVAICEKEPNQKKFYIRGIFSSEHPPELTSFFTLGTKSLGREIRKWPDLEKYAEKIDKLADKIYDKAAEISKCRPDEFNVINHGDFWVNNMMFRYNEEGKPIDHIFVDFQMCTYGSPANDLQYFLSTSVDNDVYENNKDMLLKEYLCTLSSMMKQFDCKTVPPNMEELQKALKEREFLAMTSSFTILPLVLLDKNEAKDLEEIMGQEGNEYNSSACENDIYRKVISKRIPIYDQLGLMDI
ncbi:hypothetical protein HZH68_003297 [Vespula germanica]|uniref:CHK kinase-like domain-containing protein n=1 Tax=Vespula germanica TaxID=30212 RepID=A0A834U359_VESGE|nr:hypothetical protein HZH68_003297 [Vespula germanica]